VVLGIGLAILWLWDVARVSQCAESIWVLGQARYTPTKLTALEAYPARWLEFWETVQYSFGHGILTGSAMLIVLINLRRLPRLALGYLILIFWLLGFVAIHLVLTLNLFDRNLILVLPILAIVTAW